MNEKLKAHLRELKKRRSLQTAILTTPEYDRGFEQGRKEGWNELINTLLRVNSNIIADLNEQLAIAVGDDEKKLAYWSSMETIKQYSEHLESLRNERA